VVPQFLKQILNPKIRQLLCSLNWIRIVLGSPQTIWLQLSSSIFSSMKFKFIVGSYKNLSSKLLSVLPVRKYHRVILYDKYAELLSHLCLETWLMCYDCPARIWILFHSYSDVIINKMDTRRQYLKAPPSYSLFRVRLSVQKLHYDIFELTFWPDGVMVKCFWGRLIPVIFMLTPHMGTVLFSQDLAPMRYGSYWLIWYDLTPKMI